MSERLYPRITTEIFDVQLFKVKLEEYLMKNENIIYFKIDVYRREIIPQE